ncbi:ABC transporter ATP-binding protein [Endozoicomonas atrinae]|uniref:ABC transporter ATP-binding protein n=1 Tax=Endozoicomonas atrinae TaxID=1333660 RepID=UPI00082597B1|nr:ABC transporter ATP-binding protein [Endozoicomonas atrinae]
MRQCVEFSGISHSYEKDYGEKVLALNNVNFTIEQHEFVSVVGPSGCGKSTLLRLLSGLITPSQGTVRIYDQQVDGPREDVGIVFQKPVLLPWLNVMDNVLFPVKHKYGRITQSHREQAMALLTMAGLEAFAHHRPDELSGGMQQRVGITRALLLDPDILIMDEPFSALDALTREQMGFDLLGLWREKPKTVLFITHSISEAVLLADRILVMSERPGTLVDNITIDLPRPRSLDTLQHPEFGYYTRVLRDYIYQTDRVAA